MDLRDAAAGDARPRREAGALACLLVALASVAFLLEFDVVLTFWVLYVALALALYAGWRRAGALAGCGAVFLAVLWRFVFPPLVGYLRWSWDTRYTPPRALGYKLDPRGELVEGVTHGPAYALVAAVLLGGLAYLAGSLARRGSGGTSEAER